MDNVGGISRYPCNIRVIFKNKKVLSIHVIIVIIKLPTGVIFQDTNMVLTK